jgi:hypothetical protein
MRTQTRSRSGTRRPRRRAEPARLCRRRMEPGPGAAGRCGDRVLAYRPACALPWRSSAGVSRRRGRPREGCLGVRFAERFLLLRGRRLLGRCRPRAKRSVRVRVGVELGTRKAGGSPPASHLAWGGGHRRWRAPAPQPCRRWGTRSAGSCSEFSSGPLVANRRPAAATLLVPVQQQVELLGREAAARGAVVSVRKFPLGLRQRLAQ